LLVVCFLPVTSAWAGDPPAAASSRRPEAPAKEAKEALAVFAKASKEVHPGGRIEAVRALGRVVHPRIATHLLQFAGKETDPEVLAVTYETLGTLVEYAERLLPGLTRRLRQEAEAEAERTAKGDAGFLVDPRTGDADTKSIEGRAHLAASRSRWGQVSQLLRALRALGWADAREPALLLPFLQSADDALVVEVLGHLRRYPVEAVLPRVLELFRMYPTPFTWETGAVVDLAGTNATAKAKWMLRFGHPDKQRARPQVVEALIATIEGVSGKRCETPEEVTALLSSKAEPRRGAKTRKR